MLTDAMGGRIKTDSSVCYICLQKPRMGSPPALITLRNHQRRVGESGGGGGGQRSDVAFCADIPHAEIQQFCRAAAMVSIFHFSSFLFTDPPTPSSHLSVLYLYR